MYYNVLNIIISNEVHLLILEKNKNVSPWSSWSNYIYMNAKYS
uniref:Uncharacterized protein n=1 Tax=Schistosoma curassoni TaxID=6186 RepID=A0A183JMH7_9TREM